MRRKLAAIGVLGFVIALKGAPAPSPAHIDVTVHEGTSMSVAVSPDGRTLAVDLQGSIWTLPASGGAATRITDIFNDARQPAFSPDGKWIAFFAYRDGGYDLWAIAPDGSNQHKLTWGAFDDREPAWSHDGTRVAFSSDRGNPLGGDYNIWTLDMRSGEFRQLTKNPADDYMPTWSPDDKEIAFASTREDGQSVWAVTLADGTERKVASAAGRVDAPSWGAGGQIVYHVTTGGGRGGSGGGPETSRYEIGGKTVTGSENVFAFRAAWATPREFYYVSDGKIRKRSADGGTPQTVEFTATMQVTRAAGSYTRRRRDFTSTVPRQVLGVCLAEDFARRQADRVCRARRHLRHAGRRQAREPHERPGARHRAGVVARRLTARLLVRQGQRAPAALGPRHEVRPQPPPHRPDDAAAGCGLVARRHPHRLLQRGRHVAGRADVGHRRGDRQGHQGARHAAAAWRARLVARRQAARDRRHRADDQTLPRRHQPDPDDVVDAAERRQVVRAAADDVDRLARRLRAGVVARRHQDGRDLRGRARGLAGLGGGRAARSAATDHQRERARAELERRFAPHPLSVDGQAADRRRRERRHPHGAVRSEVHPGDPDHAAARARRHARGHEERHAAHQRRHRRRGQQDHERRAARRGEPHRATSSTRRT